MLSASLNKTFCSFLNTTGDLLYIKCSCALLKEMRMHVYVWMYVCMYVLMYVYMYVYVCGGEGFSSGEQFQI